ncbi:hypothetical protein TNCV_4230101 [Trichonephila clavipes]|uniref:Uncharacterized protein n=1 Tax=Trichonephila clavipes TaxID=2585209 RepID=A0A8X6SNE7_TRICX|nr:hypothetical protein TNCV_4230101 [Trichonephila clavipes]
MLQKLRIVLLEEWTLFPQTFQGCGSPVDKESDHGRHAISLSPIPLKSCCVGDTSTSNLSRAQTSSCGVVVRRGGSSSGVVLVS